MAHARHPAGHPRCGWQPRRTERARAGESESGWVARGAFLRAALSIDPLSQRASQPFLSSASRALRTPVSPLCRSAEPRSCSSSRFVLHSSLCLTLRALPPRSPDYDIRSRSGATLAATPPASLAHPPPSRTLGRPIFFGFFAHYRRSLHSALPSATLTICFFFFFGLFVFFLFGRLLFLPFQLRSSFLFILLVFFSLCLFFNFFFFGFFILLDESRATEYREYPARGIPTRSWCNVLRASLDHFDSSIFLYPVLSCFRFCSFFFCLASFHLM